MGYMKVKDVATDIKFPGGAVVDSKEECIMAINYTFPTKSYSCGIIHAQLRTYKNRDERYVTLNGTSLHRVLMEYWIGRKLNRNEIVHHINENGLDNRRCNLVIMNIGEHCRQHTTKYADMDDGGFWMKYRLQNRSSAVKYKGDGCNGIEAVMSRSGAIPLISDTPEVAFWDAYRLKNYRNAYKLQNMYKNI